MFPKEIVLLILSAFMFLLGTVGLFYRKNVIVILMCFELMLNGIRLASYVISRITGNPEGEILTILIYSLSATELAVGAGLVVLLNRKDKAALE